MCKTATFVPPLHFTEQTVSYAKLHRILKKYDYKYEGKKVLKVGDDSSTAEAVPSTPKKVTKTTKAATTKSNKKRKIAATSLDRQEDEGSIGIPLTENENMEEENTVKNSGKEEDVGL